MPISTYVWGSGTLLLSSYFNAGKLLYIRYTVHSMCMYCDLYLICLHIVASNGLQFCCWLGLENTVRQNKSYSSAQQGIPKQLNPMYNNYRIVSLEQLGIDRCHVLAE